MPPKTTTVTSRRSIAPTVASSSVASAEALLKESTGIDFKLVKVSDLVFNNYNPNAMEQEVFESLTEQVKEAGGVAQTVIVRPIAGSSKYEVVDGEHRARSAKLAGVETILVANLPLDRSKAQLKTLAMNHLRGNDLPLKLATLLVSLSKDFTTAEIARATGVKEDMQINVMSMLQVPSFSDTEGSNVTNISATEAVRPIDVHVMLMPDEHGTYEEAMVKAMGIAGPMVVPLVGEEVEDYQSAMQEAMGLTGVKLRNIALLTICKAFLVMPEDMKAEIAAAIREQKVPVVAKKASKKKAAKKDDQGAGE